MRRLLPILLAATLFTAFPASVRAQSGLLSITFTTPLAGGGINLLSTGITFNKMTWNVQGTASACTVALDSAPDGVTWTAGGAIAGQTCTSNGSSAVTAGTFNFVRLNMTALTCTGVCSVTVTWTGYINNPGGGGGGNTCGSPTCTVSTAGSGSGVLALSGNTSGAATITAPAVAGTSTNPLTISNILYLASGTNQSGQEALTFASDSTAGWYSCAASSWCFARGSSIYQDFAGTIIDNASNVVFGWSSTGNPTSGQDTGLSRDAAGVLDVGNATAANTTGRVKAAGYMSVGTTFTSNAGCAETTLVGGATAGKYTSVTAGTCTVIITMGNTATAPNGWSCTATDLTTSGDAGNIHQTATTTTTASLLEGTVAANDVIQFSCIGY